MASQNGSQAVVDHLGHTVLTCASCHTPLTPDDFFELGMRLPEPDETRDEYIEDELIDYVSARSASRPDDPSH